MCRTGGRRCEDASEAVYAKKLLSARQRYYRKQGNLTKVEELEEQKENLERAREEFGDYVSPMSLVISPDTQDLLSHMSSNGLTPMIVGGSVRDAFSGTVPKDIDIEVYGGNMNTVITTLKKKYRHVDEVGKAFGVLKVKLKDGSDIDISLPRLDSKTGEGHTGFTVQTDENLTLEEATARRDFTFNAMLYSSEHKALVDPYGGKKDLDAQTLKHVSPAFTEDPLRVMRGFQFASRFNMSMDPRTVELCQELRSQSSSLAEERMGTEWEKFYQKGDHPSQGMTVLQQTGWDSHYAGLAEVNTPQLRQHLDNAVPHVKKMEYEPRQRIMSAIIARKMNKEDSREFTHKTIIGKKLASSSHFLSQVTTPEQKDSSIREFSRELTKRDSSVQEWYVMASACEDKKADAVLQHAKRLKVDKTAPVDLLTGKDILNNTDKKPGQWMGIFLKKAQSAQDRGEFTTKKQALSWMKKNI